MDLSTFASQKDFEDELLLLAALDGLVRVIYKNKSSLYLLPLSLCLRVGGHPPFRKKKNLVFVF